MSFLSLLCKWKAGDSIEVISDRDVGESSLPKKSGYNFTLIIADFQSYESSGIEKFRTFGRKEAEEIETI